MRAYITSELALHAASFTRRHRAFNIRPRSAALPTRVWRRRRFSSGLRYSISRGHVWCQTPRAASPLAREITSRPVLVSRHRPGASPRKSLSYDAGAGAAIGAALSDLIYRRGICTLRATMRS